MTERTFWKCAIIFAFLVLLGWVANSSTPKATTASASKSVSHASQAIPNETKQATQIKTSTARGAGGSEDHLLFNNWVSPRSDRISYIPRDSDSAIHFSCTGRFSITIFIESDDLRYMDFSRLASVPLEFVNGSTSMYEKVMFDDIGHKDQIHAIFPIIQKSDVATWINHFSTGNDIAIRFLYDRKWHHGFTAPSFTKQMATRFIANCSK